MSSREDRFAPLPTLPTGQAHPHPSPIGGEQYSAVELMPGFRVVILDQRRLPTLERYVFCSTVEEVSSAIESMVVRGAPAIGITAAYGMVLAAVAERGGGADFVTAMSRAAAGLRRTRPTAVNLGWALDRMNRLTEALRELPWSARIERFAEDARALHVAEIAACRAVGAFGAPRVPDTATILTHCNAGALATGGYGTALGVVRAAREAGKNVRVLACETRPYLQGARLTAWELAKDHIPVEVITDSMAAHFMAKGAVDLVVVGADRIARNGDTANKIGTYGLACIASMHDVPFYVAAPWSTFDQACPNGDAIPIEERPERELSHLTTLEGTTLQLVPDGVRVRNPSFDVTPHGLITGIITERGLVQPVTEGELATLATQ